MLIHWGTSLAAHLTTPFLTDLYLLVPRPVLTEIFAAPLGTSATPSIATPLTRERLDALTLAVLALVTMAYVYGAARLWHRGGQSMGAISGRLLAFVGGVVTLTIALLPPIDQLTTQLFAMQIGQYLLLTTVIPPLIVLGAPGATLMAVAPTVRAEALSAWWATRPHARRVWEVATQPPVVAALDIILLLAWYQPRPFDAALTSGVLHLGEQLSILIAALLFWWTVRHPDARPTLAHGRVLVSFVAASLASAAFGLALFLARTPWYGVYGDSAAAWSLTALGDQQVGGILLGVAPELIDLIAALFLIWGWIHAQERRATATARAERLARRAARAAERGEG
jgi:putative membrane protein